MMVAEKILCPLSKSISAVTERLFNSVEAHGFSRAVTAYKNRAFSSGPHG
jgi:hypothetical protein